MSHVTPEEYDRLVKQPMDLGTIKVRLDKPGEGYYKSISEFSKDVNRIFSNVAKVWSPGHFLADAARRLQRTSLARTAYFDFEGVVVFADSFFLSFCSLPPSPSLNVSLLSFSFNTNSSIDCDKIP